MEQLLEIGSADRVDAWFDDRIDNKKRIYGFGHRVYKTEDPRATILRDMAREVAERSGTPQWYDIASRLEERVLAHPYFQERRIYTNVDYYTGPLLYALDIPVDLFIPMFAVSRIAGWTAHMLEQQENNRLIRPRALYAGPQDVTWTPMDEREPMVEAQPDEQCVAGRPANCPAALRVPPLYWPT
jgi:citrate synthase